MRRLPPLLRRAWYSLNQSFRQRISHLGITPDQYSILRWLSEGPEDGLIQTELTKFMASDPNTITAILRRMEAARLLCRPQDPADKRAKRVRILPRGKALFEEARVIANALQEDVLSNLDSNERDHFLLLLEKVANACSRQIGS